MIQNKKPIVETRSRFDSGYFAELSYSGFVMRFLSYLLAKANESGGYADDGIADCSDFANRMVIGGFLTKETFDVLDEVVRGKAWEPEKLPCRNLTADAIRDRLLHSKAREGLFSSETSTPTCVSTLAIKVLDIQPGETVADFGCGEGSFLVAAKEAQPDAKFFGMDINPNAVVVAKLRSELLGGGIDAELDNMFEDKYTYGAFDKVFSNYPLGMRPGAIEGESNYLSRVRQGLPEYGRPTSADWVFNRLLFDSLADSGRAVGVMASGSSLNGMDGKIRRYFVENGMIEAVVALPSNLLPYTGAALSLVVLSHGNKGIRFVDGTHELEKGRRQNTLSEANIETIVNALACDTDISRYRTNEEIAALDYILSPARMIKDDIEFDDAVPFGSLITTVTRGASIRAAILDDITVGRETDTQYLMLRDIRDGRISTQLPYLSGIDPKLEKHCIKNGDLLLSKNGAPYKVAVASVPEGKKILANGNLYIIRLNTEKVDPHYVAAFLQGPTGKELLARSSVGATIPNLPLSNVKSIPIPLVPLEEQRRIVDRYEAKLDQIEVLKLKLEQAREEAQLIFDEEC